MFLRDIRETAGSSNGNEAIEVWNLPTPFMTVWVKFKKVFKVALFGIEKKKFLSTLSIGWSTVA
jgi:hypothetical protein